MALDGGHSLATMTKFEEILHFVQDDNNAEILRYAQDDDSEVVPV
jgi:hypothetical protein